MIWSGQHLTSQSILFKKLFAVYIWIKSFIIYPVVRYSVAVWNWFNTLFVQWLIITVPLFEHSLHLLYIHTFICYTSILCLCRFQGDWLFPDFFFLLFISCYFVVLKQANFSDFFLEIRWYKFFIFMNRIIN